MQTYNFSISGLKIRKNDTVLSFDPMATCQVLQDLGVIEDFASDKNGEPVILFADNSTPVGYGFEFWSDFVKSFTYMQNCVRIYMERRESAAASAVFQARVINLLSPLQAA